MNLQKLKDKLEQSTQDVIKKLELIRPFTGTISVKIDYKTHTSGITGYSIGIEEKTKFDNEKKL